MLHTYRLRAAPPPQNERKMALGARGALLASPAWGADGESREKRFGRERGAPRHTDRLRPPPHSVHTVTGPVSVRGGCPGFRRITLRSAPHSSRTRTDPRRWRSKKRGSKAKRKTRQQTETCSRAERRADGRPRAARLHVDSRLRCVGGRGRDSTLHGVRPCLWSSAPPRDSTST